MSLTKITHSMISGATLSVLDYGAKGDGTTDDTASIQATLEAAYAMSPKPVVYFPAGRYKVTDSLVLKDYMTLRGAGRNNSVIVSNFANKSVIRTQYGENPSYAQRTVVWDFADFSLENSLPVSYNSKLAAGGSANTIVLDSTASDVDGYYVGWLVNMEGGPAQDQRRNIVAYNGATKTATVDSNWVVNPSSVDRYRLETNAIGLNMGNVSYSIFARMRINNYTKCVYATHAGYYNTWDNIRTLGFVCFWLQSDGGGNALLNCEAEFTYNGVRVEQGDFIQTNGIVESLLDDTQDGTAQAGGASTITLSSGASATNQRYTGYKVLIESGTGAGQSRTISDYNGTTKVATVSSAWSTQPDNTSVYHVHPGTTHTCYYVGFGTAGTAAAFKSVNVYFETYARSGALGLYGPTMHQCTLISPSKRGYASLLNINTPSEFIVQDFLGDSTPWLRTIQTEYSNGIQGSISAILRAPYGNQINVYSYDNVNLGHIGAASFCPLGDYNRRWTSGSGSPEGSVTASPGALYTNTGGGAGTTLYVKETGSGNTGWVAK